MFDRENSTGEENKPTSSRVVSIREYERGLVVCFIPRLFRIPVLIKISFRRHRFSIFFRAVGVWTELFRSLWKNWFCRRASCCVQGVCRRGIQGSIASSPTERTPSMRSKISGSPSVSTAEILVGWWRTSSVTGRRTPPISWESVSGLGSLPEGWPSSSRRKF